LALEINNALIEGLVDIEAFVSIMEVSMVREFSIMHLRADHETYKITSRIITQVLGRIAKLPMKVGKIIYQVVFLMVDINNYNLLLGLDFLMTIRIVVDVEKGVIQVHNRPCMEVEILLLNLVNML
jgi:hypothetical protein